jgi:hypothetical protein
VDEDAGILVLVPVLLDIEKACIIELDGRGIMEGDMGRLPDPSSARDGGRIDWDKEVVPARLGVRCGKRDVDLLRPLTEVKGDGIPGRVGNLLEVDF